MSIYYRWKGHAELVLENYHKNRQILMELERDAIYATPKTDSLGITNSNISDKVSSTVIRLQAPRIQVIRQEVDAVDSVRRRISARKNGRRKSELMKAVWLERKNTLMSASQLMGLNYKTAMRWKKEILTLLAIEMGWM